MAQRITKRLVDSLEATGTTESGKPKRLLVFDTELRGFGVRVTPAGAKSYFVDYRVGGGRAAPKKRHVIGAHGSPWTPDTARDEARRILAEVAGGGDPAAERKTRRQGPDEARTFAAVVQRYASLHGRRLRASTLADYQHVFSHYLEPVWGQRDVAAIERRDVTELVDGVEQRAPVRARTVFAFARSFFGWCVEKDYRTDNPCDGLKGPPPPKARDRVLDDDELRLVWQATRALGYPFGPAFRLLILTAARRDEVGGLAWNELDLGAAVWRLPAERAKNDSGHELDLDALAVAELETIPQARPLVFTATGKPLQGWSRAKARLDREIKKLNDGKPLASWRTHDLRRTAATGMAAAGFAPQVVERVLNHKSGVRGGLVGVYQRHEYRAERKAASLAWAAHVARVVSGKTDAGNVIELTSRGG